MPSILHRFRTLSSRGQNTAAAALCVHPGTINDYHALARFHYRTARPATVERILTMRQPDADEPVAILIISRPTLNAPWRSRIWPQLFSGDKRARALAANQHIRTISRVIVDPRWRGLGLAGTLIRAYLDHPLTRYTEAVATMACACPIFTAAGMTPVDSPPSRHTERLRRALANDRIQPWRLLDPAFHDHLVDNDGLLRALRTWARATRAHRAYAQAPMSILAPRAATTLARPRTVYIYESPP